MSTTSVASLQPPSKAAAQNKQRLRFMFIMGWQELERRFAKSLLGGLWLFLGPALLAGVYWIVFEFVIGIRFTNPLTNEEVPFLAAFSIGFFSYLTLNEMMGQGVNWLRSKRRTITETDLPLWTVLGVLMVRAFIQYVAYLFVSIGICVGYGLTDLSSTLLYLAASIPIFVMFAGVSVVVAFLGLFFPDVREIIPVLLRVVFYASTISFPLQAVPEQWRWVLLANPLTWAIELNRDLLLWSRAPDPQFLAIATLGLVAIWGIAILFYMRLRKIVPQVV